MLQAPAVSRSFTLYSARQRGLPGAGQSAHKEQHGFRAAVHFPLLKSKNERHTFNQAERRASSFWQSDRRPAAVAREARGVDARDRGARRLEHDVDSLPEAVPVARHGPGREVEAEVVGLLGAHAHAVRSAVLPWDAERAQVVLPVALAERHGRGTERTARRTAVARDHDVAHARELAHERELDKVDRARAREHDARVDPVDRAGSVEQRHGPLGPHALPRALDRVPAGLEAAPGLGRVRHELDFALERPRVHVAELAVDELAREEPVGHADEHLARVEAARAVRTRVQRVEAAAVAAGRVVESLLLELYRLTGDCRREERDDGDAHGHVHGGEDGGAIHARCWSRVVNGRYDAFCGC